MRGFLRCALRGRRTAATLKARVLPGAPLTPAAELARLPEWNAFRQPIQLTCGDPWQIVPYASPAAADETFRAQQEPPALPRAAVKPLNGESRPESGESWPESWAKEAAQGLLKEGADDDELRALVRWSPFWLEEMRSEQLCGLAPDGRDGLLIRCRLAQICLALIDLLGGNLEESRVLLLRFRFRALAALSRPANLEGFKRLDSGWQQLRDARQAYAVDLLEREALVNRALARAQPETGASWDLDAEMKLLISDEQDGNLWPFSDRSLMNRQVTDELLRHGLLARNDLGGTARAVAAHLNQEHAAENDAGWLRRGAAWGMDHLQAMVLGSALLAFVGLQIAALTGSQSAASLFVYAGIGVGALAVLLWCAAFVLLGFRRMAMYPLALRVPALAFLGVLALIGLGNFATFGLRAWDSSGTAWLLAGVGLIVPLGYIFFETQTRVADVKRAACRSFFIWLYALATVFWLTFWAARFVPPLVLCGMEGCETPARVFEGLGGTAISTDFVLFVTPLALSIGVMTQLFWEDTAIAEPI